MKTNIIQAINSAESAHALRRDPGNDLVAGQIYAANEARFTAAHYSEPLTAYTLGWKDPENLEQVLEQIAPSVEVGRRFEFKQSTNAEAFLSETDDIRAIGSPFKRVEYTGSSVNEKTHNKGLTVRIDHDDVVGDAWREQTVDRLMMRLLRNDLRRGLVLLNAAANNQARTWTSGSPNPDDNCRTELKAAADISGIRPNTVLFAEAAFDARTGAYEASTAPAAARKAAMTPAELAAHLMVDLVLPVKARYQSTSSAKAGVMAASTVLFYLALRGVTKDDPSDIKRFVTPTPGGRFRVYVTEHEKFTDISVEHYSNIVITSGLSGNIRKITVS
jgi:hypothetical protein